MTGPARALVVLRQAGLLAALLVLVAGILGMHVMTAGHSSHAGHGGVATVASHAAPAKHGESSGNASSSGHETPGHLAGDAGVVHSAAGMPPAGATCTTSCPDAHSAGPSCTPLAAAGSLAALPPAALPGVRPGTGAGTVKAGSYSHVVPSPTPCELSISRT